MFTRAGSIGGAVALGFFCLLWTGVTGTADFFAFRGITHQLRSLGFSTTTGRILASEVKTSRGSKGSTLYAPHIRYEYEVAGQRQVSERWRHSMGSSSDSAWAYAALRENPVCAERPVYYDPRAPAEAVLQRGLNGSDLFILMFLTPFNAVMLALWLGLGLALFRRGKPTQNPPRQLREEPHRLTLPMPTVTPLAGALLTLGVACFLTMFPVAFLGGGFHPSLPVAISAWGLVLSLTLAVFFWRWARLRSGREDLVIDFLKAEISLPQNQGRKARVTLPLAQVAAVDVEETERRGQKGRTFKVWTVWLNGKSAGSRQKLLETQEAEQAGDFARWLRGRLGLPG